MDLPIKNGDFPVRYVSLPEGINNLPIFTWLVVEPAPRKNEFVGWDDDIPNKWKNKIHVPNHKYLPIQNGDVPYSYIKLPFRVPSGNEFNGKSPSYSSMTVPFFDTL